MNRASTRLHRVLRVRETAEARRNEALAGARQQLDELIQRARREVHALPPVLLGYDVTRFRVRDIGLAALLARPAAMPAQIDVTLAEADGLSQQADGPRIAALASIAQRYSLDGHSALSSVIDAHERGVLTVEGEPW